MVNVQSKHLVSPNILFIELPYSINGSMWQDICFRKFWTLSTTEPQNKTNGRQTKTNGYK